MMMHRKMSKKSLTHMPRSYKDWWLFTKCVRASPPAALKWSVKKYFG
jgi:hypothetical protein